ncbi:MAG: UDP-N-acetylmuramoyl-L-alanyl-D-glutamate--2,6-diaminopimelate ligase [Deltaproteobacteria bacterium]|nr:UDP-N-acetylmuramoyl-L-alanyl-D-glutamate--2,6-diaminopimelate ligase [Deltaproteobacteria bacterium]
MISELPGATLLDPGDPEIGGVTCDSRRVRPGDLFAAVRGTLADGHLYLEAAARAGAAACLVEEERPAFGLPRVRVADSEAALGLASSAFWGHPSRRLLLVGLTGTNGKTTTAYLIQRILEEQNICTGRLGTVSYCFPTREEPAPLTTPDAPTLQRALARMLAEGARAAVMEVSSHSLARRRVEGCAFSCAVFTNLTQDHLDYHGSMETYYEAKKVLFTRYRREAPAVVNAEDPWGRRLLGELSGSVISYGLESGDVRFEVEDLGASGAAGRLRYPGGETPLSIPLAGAFNAQNAAAAMATAWALELDLERAAETLGRAPQVPGRLEAVGNDAGLSVYVDYAHTPDALERVLEAVRAVARGRVLCVFGCGGDRDRGKRPLMARAAAALADAVVLTADNSRSEPTEAILDAIQAGLPREWRHASAEDFPEALEGGGPSFARVPDRAAAIRLALFSARPGDAVVIAGKGHETTQDIGGVKTPFDDREVAREALAERLSGGGKA